MSLKGNKNKGRLESLIGKLFDKFLVGNKRGRMEVCVYRINRLEAIFISMRNLSFILEIGWEFMIGMNIGVPAEWKRIRL